MTADASGGPEPVAVRKLRSDEVEPILDVMARAFDADPVMNFVVKQDRRRGPRLRGALKAIFLEPCLPHGESYVSDGLEGGAFWIPPGKRERGLLANLRQLPHLVRAAGLARVPGLVAAMDVVDKKHPHEPHFYLPMIGVDPQHQGRGLGSALMRPVLERCDRDGIPAYLESSNERNVPLYERNGFRVTEEVRLGRTGPAMWLMWRDPQAVTPDLRPDKRGLATQQARVVPTGCRSRRGTGWNGCEVIGGASTVSASTISGGSVSDGGAGTPTTSRLLTVTERRDLDRRLAPVYPGEVLREEFSSPIGISQYRLAKDISVPPRRINEIVHRTGAPRVFRTGFRPPPGQCPRVRHRR